MSYVSRWLHKYTNHRMLSYTVYLLIFVYTFVLARLLSHNGGHFIFVALLFIILARYKFAFNASLIYSTLLATLFSPCMVYGEINSDLVLNFLIADKSSVSEFITTLPAKLFASVAFILVLTFVLIKQRNFLLIKNTTFYILVAIVASHMFIYPPIKVYSKNAMRDKGESFHLSSFLYGNANFIIRDSISIRTSYKSALMELDKQARALAAKPDWNPDIAQTDFDTYVVVIGESARRDALHAYGFAIENTPFLSNIPRVQFNNYIAIGGDTIISLSNTFVLDYHKNGNMGNNIVDLAKLAKFKTYWLSDQNEVGMFDSIISGIGKKADYAHFLNFSGSKQALFDDSLLLPHIAQALQDESQAKKLIFVHLYGSHMPFCNRTQGKYEVFHVNKKLSCYVHSIKQTDDLLKDIYHLLQNDKQQTDKEWAMVYFSDHGLAANSSGKTILHGQKYKTNYAAPFVILNSKLTETTFIDAPRSGLNFFDFFAGWTGIEDKLISKQCDFISEKPCANSTTVIRHDNSEADFSSLEEEKINYFQ